jgi:uncharacterized protein YbjT (DUF2867 family)
MNGGEPRQIAVFGGTGFLGGRIVRHLVGRNFVVRVISRRPNRAEQIFRDQPAGLKFVTADATDENSVATAVAGAFGIVNAISLYTETHGDNEGDRTTFYNVHVRAAARIARYAEKLGARIVHVSGIGADSRSPSDYIRARGEGEIAVWTECPDAVIARPAVMFGPKDAFLYPLLDLLRRFPVFPLFGRGHTAMQPVYVEDVAEAIARMFDGEQSLAYDLGGPRIYRYIELLALLRAKLQAHVAFVPVPFPLWRAVAHLTERLPQLPITRGQIELMEIDTVADPDAPGFADLDIKPRDLESVLAALVK